MSYFRTIKIKQWLAIFSLFVILAFVISNYDQANLRKRIPNLMTNTHVKSPVTTPSLSTLTPILDTSAQQQQHSSSSSPPLPYLAYSSMPFMKYNRLSIRHQQILTSALAHIRLGYVANRTPYYDTPPLLLLYSCKDDENDNEHIDKQKMSDANHEKKNDNSNHCGTLEQRLISIANSYYFSMLQQGSAFAFDMTSPVRLEWFFESSPNYMSMNVDQAKLYLSKVSTTTKVLEEDSSSNNNNRKVKSAMEDYLEAVNQEQLEQRNFLQEYTVKGVTILHTNTDTWSSVSSPSSVVPQWMSMTRNPSMKALRDKYRLNHLPQPQSDAFWIISRLLFSKPTPAMRELLTPYYDLMGGKFELWHDGTDLSLTGNSVLSPLDPRNTKVSQSFIDTKKDWFRVGLRVTAANQVKCAVQHAVRVCDKEEGTSCHVFVSTSTETLLRQVKSEFNKKNSSIYIHAVEEKRYRFNDLNHEKQDTVLGVDRQFNLFADSEEERYRKLYARVFMDWMILARMDYLIGPSSSDFIKTAAWTAQVQTDIITTTSDIDSAHCQIIPMSDW
ncbi:hypothetical protein BDF20DRAFT_858647 [Mycotypha africana]|uniref:uncharacterized protein n=1 Tax=Mycotypha africana TaxID=64632 RepID=UPI002301D9D3|nr:uncharacterized protein BDF20DRAFT_858647 [Mycotypha africana]KAI8984214.1 hypothetical protein BDF20DRAFT_858647 [Mycotypha africana]